MFLLRFNLSFKFYVSHGVFSLQIPFRKPYVALSESTTSQLAFDDSKNVKLMMLIRVFWILKLVQHNFLTPIYDLPRDFFSYNLNGVQFSVLLIFIFGVLHDLIWCF